MKKSVQLTARNARQGAGATYQTRAGFGEANAG